MGTRSLIAKQTGPDTYRAVFCQLDGHLESQGAMLLEHFSTAQKVDELLALGDLYVLYPALAPDPSRPHNFENRQKDVTVAFHRDWGMEDMAAKDYTLEGLDSTDDLIEFVFIFNQDGEWKYFQGCYLDEGLRDVKEDLELLEQGVDVIKPPPFDFDDLIDPDVMDDGPMPGMAMG